MGDSQPPPSGEFKGNLAKALLMSDPVLPFCTSDCIVMHQRVPVTPQEVMELLSTVPVAEFWVLLRECFPCIWGRCPFACRHDRNLLS